MTQKVNVIVADPAGNITIFVQDRFERKQYSEIANKLLKLTFTLPSGKVVSGEQVAFINDCPECGRARGKMEMCGLEFCGNASRSFALITAKELGIKGRDKVSIDVSGVNEILDVEVDTDTSFTKIKMPRPLNIFKEKILKYDATWADFGGILHLILVDVECSKEKFEQIRESVYIKYNPPALGVMFWNETEKKLEPVVYVRDVDTTYFEGSCGSGTTAISCVFGLEKGDGEHEFSFRQPEGTIDSSCIVKDGKIDKVFIQGNVELSDLITVEI